jgi:hypothetical protein
MKKSWNEWPDLVFSLTIGAIGKYMCLNTQMIYKILLFVI